jgi:hypothetical protein
MTVRHNPSQEPNRPVLEAWRVTNEHGETTRIVVGRRLSSEARIEIDPDGLITDEDAFEDE